MTSRDITEANPAGAQPFDHTPVAGLPEYRALQEALDALARKVSTMKVGQRRFLDMAGEAASVLAFADSSGHKPWRTGCANRDGVWFPYRVEINEQGTGLQGWYGCLACGQAWTCGYALTFPSVMAGA